MNVLDLFNTVYERALNEGAVDDLEARYIHGLNTKMLDLMSRARSADPAHKQALKREYEKIKGERDSFYKIREAQTGQDIVDPKQKMQSLTPSKPGVAGAVKDVARGLKNFLQGKPETGPTYEAQKKSSETVDEHGGGIGPSQRWQDLMPEGWSDKYGGVMRPPTPYSVYIKGRKWKDFATDDHAQAVANKLKAKFKVDGRDPETITIAPSDMSEEKTRLDPKCWPGKKIGTPKTKVKGGVRVNNCVPAESINEVKDTEAVEQAILKRIMVAHRDMLMKFGPEKIMSAAGDVAYNVGDVGEVGSSDVSGWVKQVQQILGAVQEDLQDPADNPCWKGYKPVGTKKKAGRTVPNCVPK